MAGRHERAWLARPATVIIASPPRCGRSRASGLRDCIAASFARPRFVLAPASRSPRFVLLVSSSSHEFVARGLDRRLGRRLWCVANRGRRCDVKEECGSERGRGGRNLRFAEVASRTSPRPLSRALLRPLSLGIRGENDLVVRARSWTGRCARVRGGLSGARVGARARPRGWGGVSIEVRHGRPGTPAVAALDGPGVGGGGGEGGTRAREAWGVGARATFLRPLPPLLPMQLPMARRLNFLAGSPPAASRASLPLLTAR